MRHRLDVLGVFQTGIFGANFGLTMWLNRSLSLLDCAPSGVVFGVVFC